MLQRELALGPSRGSDMCPRHLLGQKKLILCFFCFPPAPPLQTARLQASSSRRTPRLRRKCIGGPHPEEPAPGDECAHLLQWRSGQGQAFENCCWAAQPASWRPAAGCEQTDVEYM